MALECPARVLAGGRPDEMNGPTLSGKHFARISRPRHRRNAGLFWSLLFLACDSMFDTAALGTEQLAPLGLLWLSQELPRHRRNAGLFWSLLFLACDSMFDTAALGTEQLASLGLLWLSQELP